MSWLGQVCCLCIFLRHPSRLLTSNGYGHGFSSRHNRHQSSEICDLKYIVISAEILIKYNSFILNELQRKSWVNTTTIINYRYHNRYQSYRYCNYKIAHLLKSIQYFSNPAKLVFKRYR